MNAFSEIASFYNLLAVFSSHGFPSLDTGRQKLDIITSHCVCGVKSGRRVKSTKAVIFINKRLEGGGAPNSYFLVYLRKMLIPEKDHTAVHTCRLDYLHRASMCL